MLKHSERLLTVREAANRLGFKEATIRRRILERRIAYVKNGRSVRIPIEVVNQQITENWRDPIEPNGEHVPVT